MPKAVQAMGVVRHNEAIAAAKKFGLSSDHLTFLGYPDFRTLEIWYKHWGDNPPAKSMLTQVKAVPYDDALRPGTPYKGEKILRDIRTIIKEFNPTKIFLSHPADHNPGHRALYFFTRVSLWDLDDAINPVIYPYLIHSSKWPQPVLYKPDEKLHPPHKMQDKAQWFLWNLKKEEVALKHEALKEHRSQYNSSAKYLRLFIRTNELFGDFPLSNLKNKYASVSLEKNQPLNEENVPDRVLTSCRTYLGNVPPGDCPRIALFVQAKARGKRKPQAYVGTLRIFSSRATPA